MAEASRAAAALRAELHALHRERLRRLDRAGGARHDVLAMKVKLLQSYVMDLSDQNEVLVQAMEELEREAAWKVTTLEAELQAYVARVTECKQENSTLQITKANLQKEISRPVPTEHLSGSAATQTTDSSSGRGIELEDLGAQVASKGQLIHQLSVQRREAARSHEKAKAEVLEKEAKIQELQQIITGLHQEISLKDLEAASKIQAKHLFETKIQSLQQMASSALTPCCPESQLSCSQASKLLKAELECRDAKTQSLQNQLLLQQDKGDSLAAELDAQEQRIYQLQTKQRERQAELEQKHSQIQQLEQDVEASRRLQDESQRQLAECNVRLGQVEGENEALRVHQREQLLEVEDWVASLRSSERARECVSCEAGMHEREEQAAEQVLLQQRVSGLQDELWKKEATMHRLQTELQDTSQLVQEAKAQLAGAEAEVVFTRSKCSTALREAAESSAALQGLRQRTAEQEAAIHQLESLARARLDERQRAAEQDQVQELTWGLRRAAAEAQAAEQKASLGRGAVGPCCRAGSALPTQGCRLLRHRHTCLWHHEDTLQRLRDELVASQVAAKGSAQAQERQLQEAQALRSEVRSRDQIIATLERRLGAAEEELARAAGEGQTRALLLEQLQAELQLSQESRQAELQGRRQELDACKRQLKEVRVQLRQQKAMMAARGQDLEHQLQQCRVLQEEVQQQAQELARQQEQLQTAQERLAVAEGSFSLCREQHEAVLSRVQSLERGLGDARSQVRERDDAIASLCSERLAVRSRAEAAVEQLHQELQATQEDLACSRQQAQQCEDEAQGLREQLAASHSQVVASTAALRDAQSEFASYAAAHSHSDASYDRLALQATALQQRLLELEVESTVHQQRAEEAERLAQDWELQLEQVAEQKRSTMRDLEALELELQGLRQNAAAQAERTQLEAAEQQQRVQRLEQELQESHQRSAQRAQAVQRREKHLQQARAELAQAQAAQVGMQQEQQRSMAAGAALRQELQGLRESLQQEAVARAQQEERALLAQGSLQSVQEQLRQCQAEAVQLQQDGQHREAELRVLRDQAATSQQEAQKSRELLQRLREELSQWQEKHKAATRQGLELQQAVATTAQQLGSSQEQVQVLQQQLQAQEVMQQALNKEWRQEQCRAGELQEQLQHATDQLRDQEQQNHSLQHHRSQLETEVQELREQLQQCQVQLQGAQQQATHHVAALGQLQEALQAAEARTGQSQVTATETARELQQAHASSQQELAAALGQADILRSSLEAARADSQRLQHESELVLADVQQWATEQKRANERLGQKLREQSKQLVRLTGEREHLQEVLAQLQQQNKRLAATAEQQRITCERLRALQGRSVDAGALLHWPWLPLPGEDSGPACAQQPLPLPSAVDHEPRQTAQP